MEHSPGQRATRIFAIGSASDIEQHLAELDAFGNVELAGTSRSASAAVPRIATASPEVIVFLLPEAETSLPADLAPILQEHSTAPVIVLAHDVTGALIEEASLQGVHDLLVLPQPAEQLLFAIRKAGSFVRRAAEATGAARASLERARMVTFFSAKGGVGSTTLAVNAATVYAQQFSQRTLLIDLDFASGDVALAMGATPRLTVLDLFMTQGDLDAETLGRFVHRHDTGVHLLPAPLLMEDAQMLKVSRVTDLLKVARSAYDVVIIDTPCDLNGHVLTAIDATDDLVVVSSMDVAAIKSARVTMQTLELIGVPAGRCHLAMNRMGSSVELDEEHLRDALGLEPAFTVPSSRIVPVAMNRGVPVVVGHCDSAPAASIVRMCRQLAPERVPRDAGARRSILPFGRKRVAHAG